MPPRIGTGTAACFLVGWWGLRWLERRLCGAVVAAVPRKRSGNRRCVSWLEGTGCGGTAGFSFRERPARAEVSAGQWLLPFLGNGPGTGGVFLGRRGRAAAGRSASLSGRERVRTDALRGGGCCRSPETVREQAVCFLVEGDGLRRGGVPLFRGENGFERMLCGAVVAAAPRKRPGCRRRASLSEGTGCGGAASLFFGERRVRTRFPSPPLFAAIARCLRFRSSPPASPLPVIISSSAVACTPAASHPPHQLPATPPPVSPPPVSPPPATSATAACHPCRCLPPRCLSLFPACYHPPPAARYLPPATCRPLPPPLSASPLLPAVPPLLTSRTRCLPFPPPCAGRADRWAAAAPRVVGRGAMRRRREVLRNNLENRKILPIFVSVKYRGSGLSRPGFLFFIGLSFLWQKRLSI